MICFCCRNSLEHVTSKPVIDWDDAPNLVCICPECLRQVVNQEKFVLEWGRNNVASFASRLGSNKDLLKYFGFVTELNMLEAVCLGYRLIAIAAVRLEMTAKDLIDQAQKQRWNSKIVIDACCLAKPELVSRF